MTGKSAEAAAFVLDASALLSYLKGEDGGEIVQRILRQCCDSGTRAAVTASDLLDVYIQVARDNPGALDDLLSLVSQLPLEVLPVTAETAETAARLLASSTCPKPELACAMVNCLKTGATLVTKEGCASGMPGCLYLGPPLHGAGVSQEMSKS